MHKSDFQVVAFKDKYEKFSNFYPVCIIYEDMEFYSVEHAFVAAKSTDMIFRRKISLLKPDQAGLAKKMGRRCKLRPNWDLMKVSVMRLLIDQKFSINEFKELLLSTGENEIIEGNYWHDNFWGNCYCKKCENIVGQNRLGKLLMEKREKLIECQGLS